MEPFHPAEEVDDMRVAGAILVILWIVVLIQLNMGHWDHIMAQALDYFPLWRWGG